MEIQRRAKMKKHKIKKDKSNKDTISEEEYTSQLPFTSPSPEEDSPGDSESDAGAEFMMGLNYIPGEKNNPDSFSEDRGDIKTSIKKSNSTNTNDKDPIELLDSVKIVSSEQPSPWLDLDTEKDTH